MPRGPRVNAGGILYHVLNRGNGRRTLFHKDPDSRAFLDLLAEVQQLIPMRILGYCLMTNHWHLVLWPHDDADLSRFMHRLQTTHVRRYFQHYHDDAGGHLYQGRFKAFPVDDADEHHALTLLRYVEANPLRARLVPRAEQWAWSSLHRWHRGLAEALLTPWPMDRPADWLDRVNAPIGNDELERVRTCIARGRPYGRTTWVEQTAARLGLEFTLRPRGRPPKRTTASTEAVNQE